jgi:PadR family transcriptional regulator, regulatory protein AphA
LRLKPSAYLMLGMLRAGIGTGYAIKRAVDQSTRFFWSTSFAQVYPELARLEEQDYIVGHDDPQGDRPRRKYRLTEKGEEALDSWLRSSSVPLFEFRDEGLLRLFFADALPEVEAIALVRRLREHAEQADRAFREDILPLAGTAPEQGYRFPLIAARLGADYYSWRASWLASVEAEIGRQPVPGRARARSANR